MAASEFSSDDAPVSWRFTGFSHVPRIVQKARRNTTNSYTFCAFLPKELLMPSTELAA
jgi:hypothetical protein